MHPTPAPPPPPPGPAHASRHRRPPVGAHPGGRRSPDVPRRSPGGRARLASAALTCALTVLLALGAATITPTTSAAADTTTTSTGPGSLLDGAWHRWGDPQYRIVFSGARSTAPGRSGRLQLCLSWRDCTRTTDVGASHGAIVGQRRFVARPINLDQLAAASRRSVTQQGLRLRPLGCRARSPRSPEPLPAPTASPPVPLPPRSTPVDSSSQHA